MDWDDELGSGESGDSRLTVTTEALFEHWGALDADFRHVYRIDLLADDSLSWARFRNFLTNLPEGSAFREAVKGAGGTGRRWDALDDAVREVEAGTRSPGLWV